MAVNMQLINIIPKLMLVFTLVITCCYGQLSATFYLTSCPLAATTIRTLVAKAIVLDPRMGASLLRLHFHDCFVGGCDASVLLDDTTTLKGEKTAAPNDNSLRGFEVIDTIKTAVDLICGARSVVSCADILAIAARDSVNILGGPTWIVPLGRRDSTTAFFDAANTDLPSPTSSIAELTKAFSDKGLNLQDMIALSGGHTFGKARCSTFKDRIWNETNIDSTFATGLKANCPRTGGDNTLANFDQATPLSFDNAYYTNLLSQKGLLHSDQELFNNGSADATVRAYSTNSLTFYRDFATAMIKMGNISPLTGTTGQVRVNCRKVN